VVASVIRWLVADVPDFVQVTTAWSGPDEPATRRIEVRVENPAWRPEENATVALEVSRPGGKEITKLFAEPSLEEAGLFTAEFPCPEAGAWQVKANVRGGEGQDLGTPWRAGLGIPRRTNTPRWRPTGICSKLWPNGREVGCLLGMGSTAFVREGGPDGCAGCGKPSRAPPGITRSGLGS